MFPACRLQLAISVVVCFLLQAQCADKYTDENRPYEFGFEVDGQQHRHEKKDKDGIIMGEFGFITADDVYHVTVYATDKEGRFKILSMKNIHLKSSQTNPSRQGYSRALEPSPAAPKQPEKPPPLSPQPQQPLASPTPIPFKPISLEPPVKSCSSCSIPTTSTQPPPPPPPSYNENSYNNPEQVGLVPPIQRVPGTPNNSPQYPSSNAPTYPQQQGAQPVYPANYPGSQPSYPNNQQPGFGSEEPNVNAQPPSEPQNVGANPQTGPNSLGNAPPNPSSPSQSGLSERQPKQYSGSPQIFGTNTGFPQSPAIPQGPSYPQETNYPQAQNYPQQSNYPQEQYNPQTQNYPQEQNYPQQSNYPQKQNYPQTQNYPQGQNYPQSPNYPQEPNYPNQQGPNESSPGAPKPMLVTAQMQVVDKNTDIHHLNPGETAGLPPGISKNDMVRLLYTFNYTLGFQGHFEEGYSDGVKKGYYFVTGRDGIKRRIDYVADDTGFHPKVSSEVLDVLSDDVPKPETEKDAKYGLRGYEFKWLYYPVDS